MSDDQARRVLVCERPGIRATALSTVLRRAGLEPVVAETRPQALRELHRGGVDAIMLGRFAAPGGDALTLGCYVREGGVANVDRQLPMVVICAERSFGELVAELSDGIAVRHGGARHSARGIGARLRALRLRRAYEQGLARGGEER
jgi:CheY-like chemotaxis protein